MDISNGSIIQELKKLKKQLGNDMSINSITKDDKKLMEAIEMDIERNKKTESEELNDLPVYFCRHCKRLYIEIDDNGNEVCRRCGSLNEVDVLPTIEEYLNKYGHLLGDD